MRHLLTAIFVFGIFNVPIYSQGFLEESSKLAFGFYRNIMGPVKGPASECQFHPSCSNYAGEAIHEYGFAKGVLLGADRWSRCAGGRANPEKYPKIGRKFYDPPAKHYVFGTGDLWSFGLSASSGKLYPKEQFDIPNYGFARELYLQNEFQLSTLELKRIKFEIDDQDLQAYIDMLTAVNYLSGNNPQKALRTINTDYVFHNEQFRWNSFVVGFLINDILDADLWNINFCLRNDTIIKGRSNEIIKFLAFSYAGSGQYEKAGETLNMLAGKGSDSTVISTSLSLIDGYDGLDSKSPFLAGTMSALIPGTGYFYCGEFKEGLSALAINGLLGWGIYSLFDNGNTGSGILLSAVAVPFYFGNIIGSVNSAGLINQKRIEVQHYKLRKSLEIDFYFTKDFLVECWDAVN